MVGCGINGLAKRPSGIFKEVMRKLSNKHFLSKSFLISADDGNTENSVEMIEMAAGIYRLKVN
eukprot:scaffold4654_cov123-Skeletonema_menzelii.AAC.15